VYRKLGADVTVEAQDRLPLYDDELVRLARHR
jgi:hypothetical protein